MDFSESLARVFLESRGYGDAVYEPDGNVPPDFSCGGIAVEVRRLNQHDKTGHGLEETEYPLVGKFRMLLASFGPPRSASWFVTFQFRRPIEKWRTLAPKIRGVLASVGDNLVNDVVRIRVTETFSIAIFRASELHDSRFVHGGHTDHESGGWLVSETIRNLAIVIPEKTRKITPYQSKYPEWWLVLVDCIGYANFDADELNVLRRHVVRPSEWAKIFLLNPLDPRRAIEV